MPTANKTTDLTPDEARALVAVRWLGFETVPIPGFADELCMYRWKDEPRSAKRPLGHLPDPANDDGDAVALLDAMRREKKALGWTLLKVHCYDDGEYIEGTYAVVADMDRPCLCGRGCDDEQEWFDSARTFREAVVAAAVAVARREAGK